MREQDYVLGVDFGSDSVRALVVHVRSGECVGEAVREYPRWKEGRYCDPARRQFRQHPLDYLESFTACVRAALDQAGPAIAGLVRALGIDTTGSTPCPVDAMGTPLSLLPEFAEDPDAMFHLWKDHTAVAEAEEITRLFQAHDPDYTRYQGPYSSEWYWAKVLHTTRRSPAVRARATGWVEHCDWLTSLLTGRTEPARLYRSACAAGHKAYWHSAWGGLPDRETLSRLDPALAALAQSFSPPLPCTAAVGRITPGWADRLGLPAEVLISGCTFDAHAGAIGAGVQPGTMVINIGTSAVNMLVAKPHELSGSFAYLAGQAENSILPGYIGIETSQAAYGDTYSWLKQVLLWPLEVSLRESQLLSPEQKEALLREAERSLLPRLQVAAEAEDAGSGLVALDWFNGRRYPYNNDGASSAISGLSLGTTAPQLYRVLVEATAFGQRRIIEDLQVHGVPLQRIVAVGGIAQRSSLAMQTLSNALQFPIAVSPVKQACAYGSAIYAAVAMGAYGSIEDAQAHICPPCGKVYQPEPQSAGYYDRQYAAYLHLADLIDPTN